jgi:hypothetical protein
VINERLNIFNENGVSKIKDSFMVMHEKKIPESVICRVYRWRSGRLVVKNFAQKFLLFLRIREYTVI